MGGKKGEAGEGTECRRAVRTIGAATLEREFIPQLGPLASPPPPTGPNRLVTIEEVARQLGARTVVLHSFAHLFVELSAPAIARAILNTMEQRLTADGYATSQSAFGWFNRLELHAKGHPLSRVARQV